MPITNWGEAKILDAVFNATAFSLASTYVKLHVGNPGEDALGFPASHTTRVVASWGPAVGGLISNDANVTFSPLSANETITHISIWDAFAGGNPVWYGPMGSPQTVNIGGTLNFAVGTIIITLE